MKTQIYSLIQLTNMEVVRKNYDAGKASDKDLLSEMALTQQHILRMLMVNLQNINPDIIKDTLAKVVKNEETGVFEIS